MPYQDDLLLPQVSAGDACRAAGIDAITLKNWISRKPPAVLLSEAEKVAAGKRTFFKFSLQTVYHLAVVGRLTVGGLAPRQAHEIASAFTLLGDSQGSRLPAELYPDGRTYLVGSVRTGASYTTNVLPLDRFLGHVRQAETDGGGVAALVHVDPIIRAVRGALGLPELLA